MDKKRIEERLVENAAFVERFATEYSQAHDNLRDKVIDKVNEMVYDLAKKNGVSVYEICANFIPETETTIEQPPIKGSEFDRTTMSLVTTIKLKSIYEGR